MTHALQIQVAPPSEAMQASIDRHRAWIEEMLACPLSGTLTFELEYPFGHIVLEDLLGDVPLDRQCISAAPALRRAVSQWQLPPGASPRIELHPSWDRSGGITSARPAWDPHWKDTPIAIWLRGIEHPVISADIPYVSYIEKGAFSWRQWVIVRRDESSRCLTVLRELQPVRGLSVVGGQPVPLPENGYDWSRVVLDPSLNDLVRTDYETFWKSEDWFRKRRLPYRRGYLLYGPPGNGKTTVARIMACHPLVTAFGVALGDEGLPNALLSELFQNAADAAPAVIVLEDLERVFGARPDADCRAAITTSHFLNCLDGIGTRDGVVVVATANDPSGLNPALLKRPGRFDRLVAFPQPPWALRLEYLTRLTGGQMDDEPLAKAAAESDHLSFAQIREAYILVGQTAFQRRGTIELADLLDGFHRVRGEAVAVRSKADGAAVGFSELVSRRP